MLTEERSAEQAVIKHALLRGYLSGEQLREALVLREELRRLKRGTSLLGLLSAKEGSPLRAELEQSMGNYLCQEWNRIHPYGERLLSGLYARGIEPIQKHHVGQSYNEYFGGFRCQAE